MNSVFNYNQNQVRTSLINNKNNNYLTTSIKRDSIIDIKTRSGICPRQSGIFLCLWGTRTPNILNKSQRLRALIASLAYANLGDQFKHEGGHND